MTRIMRIAALLLALALVPAGVAEEAAQDALAADNKKGRCISSALFTFI